MLRVGFAKCVARSAVGFAACSAERTPLMWAMPPTGVVAPTAACRFNMSEPPASARRTPPRPGHKKKPSAEPHAYSAVAANPYSRFDRVRHWHMLLMCLGCAAGGVVAGRLIDMDEDTLRKSLVPPFDKDIIEAQMKQTFEFRPDLAATCLRYAFVHAAERARAAGELPDVCPATAPASAMTGFDACRSARGVQDAVALIDTLKTGFPEASRADLVAVATIAAVRFLNGPADHIGFRWGRTDPGDDEKIQASKSAIERVLEEPHKHRDTHISSSGNDNIRLTEPLVQMVPNLNLEEAFALMASHAVGEFHEDVSGIPGGKVFSRVSRHKFFLGIHYYQLLVDMSAEFTDSVLPPRPKDKPNQPTPPAMCQASAEMVHPVTGKTVTRVALVTREELESLVRDREGFEVVTSLATDQQLWADNYGKGMTKLLDSGYKNLKHYVTPRMREEEKDAKRRAVEDVPIPALARERGQTSPTASRAAVEAEKASKKA